MKKRKFTALRAALAVLLAFALAGSALPLQVLAADSGTPASVQAEAAQTPEGLAFEPLDDATAYQTHPVGTALEALALPAELTVIQVAEAEAVEITEAPVPVAAWAAQPEYAPDIRGEYLFTPAFAEGALVPADTAPVQVLVVLADEAPQDPDTLPPEDSTPPEEPGSGSEAGERIVEVEVTGLIQRGDFDTPQLVPDEDGGASTMAISNEKALIKAMGAAMSQKAASLDVSAYGIPDTTAGGDELFAAYVKAVNSNPHLFYAQTRFSYRTNLVIITQVNFSYISSTDAMAKKYEKEIKWMVDMSVDDSMSQTEMALALHDTLVLQTSYNVPAVSKGPDKVPFAWTAYGPIVQKKGVCQGYALAYSDMLRRVGISTLYVSSKQINHGWLVVKITDMPGGVGNGWYHVDPTWDDPVVSQTTPNAYGDYTLPGNARHSNFMSTEAEIRATGHIGHTIPDGVKATTTPHPNKGFWEGVNQGMFGYDGLWVYGTGTGLSKTTYGTTRQEEIITEVTHFPLRYGYRLYFHQYDDYSTDRYSGDICYYDLVDEEMGVEVAMEDGHYAYTYKISSAGVMNYILLPNGLRDGWDVTYPLKAVTYTVSKVTLTDTAAGAGGKARAVPAALRPSFATDKALTWSTSDSTIATVDAEGNVTGHATGTATITATLTSNPEVKGSCTVTVHPGVTSVALDESRNVPAGKTITLQPEVLPEEAFYKDLVWTSSNTKVATVDKNGKVKGVKASNDPAIIRATAEDNGAVYAECAVYVGPAATKLALADTKVGFGATRQLSLTFSPSGVKYKQAIWSVEDPAILSVSADGVVTGLDYGTTTVTAKWKENPAIQASCTVLVGAAVAGVDLDPTLKTVAVGKTVHLDKTVLSAVEGKPVANDEVVWTTSNKAVATVDQSGKVKGIKAGSANITVTTSEGGFAKTCKIYVGAAATGLSVQSGGLLPVGASALLAPVFTPANTANKQLVFSTSDDTIATVDQSGRITGVADGTATILAEWEENPAISARCEVTVGGSVLTLIDLVLGGSQSVEQGAIVIPLGADTPLSVQYQPANAAVHSVSYRALDGKVLALSDTSKTRATLRGLKLGTTELEIAVSDGFSTIHTERCSVKVADHTTPELTAVLSLTEKALTVGKSQALKVSYQPGTVSVRQLEWTILNNTNTLGGAILQDQGGSKFLALNPGTATVRLVAEDVFGRRSAPVDCVFTVTRPAAGVNIFKNSAADAEKRINGQTLRMVPAGMGDGSYNLSSMQLVAAALTDDPTLQAITWKSSNPQLAQVSDSGLVTVMGTAKGTVTITATAHNKKSATVKIGVVVPLAAGGLTLKDNAETAGVELALGARKTIGTDIAPNNGLTVSQTGVSWELESQTPDIPGQAVVALDARGRVTGKGLGSAVVVARAKDDDRITAKCTVQVVAPVMALAFEQKPFTLLCSGGTPSQAAIRVVRNGGGPASADLGAVTLSIPPETTAYGFVDPANSTGPLLKTVQLQPGVLDSVLIRAANAAALGDKGSLAATITAKTPAAQDNRGYAQATATLKVTVAKAVTPAISLGLNKDKAPGCGTAASPNARLQTGKSYTPKLTFAAANAARVTNTSVEWTAQASGGKDWLDYITLDPATGKVTGLAPSTADSTIITVTGVAAEWDEAALAGSPDDVTVDYSFMVEQRAAGLTVAPANPAAGDKISVAESTASPLRLKAEILPANTSSAALSWRVSDTKIATLNVGQNGTATGEVELTGLKAGKVKVTATATDGSRKSASFTVTITQQVENVVITNPPAQALNQGKGLTLKAAVNDGYALNAATGRYARLPGATTRAVRWTAKEYLPDGSPAPSGSIISLNEKTGAVKALADGYADIRVLAAADEALETHAGDVLDKKGSATTRASTCRVTVKVPVTALTLEQANFKIHSGRGTFALSAAVAPLMGQLTAGQDRLTWTIPDSGLLLFDSVDTTADPGYTHNAKTKTASYMAPAGATGITLQIDPAKAAAGKSYPLKVTVRSESGLSRTVTVTVCGSPAAAPEVTGVRLNKVAAWLPVGKAETLKATILPASAGDQNKVWSIQEFGPDNNPATTAGSVATIDQKGKVTAKGPGRAVVTVTTHDGQTTDVCTVFMVVKN